ncbi:flagellar biosynthesis protein FlgL [Novosphingobium sp. KA1]|uniref:flagellin N-terminal helical domain-containing protein n=1 Tax=Novosphingobium sp. (strain KA1) TaxID=164608 RepID=UPI001A8FB78F|nr:flagellar biosynthesis protein FlgL [Novosphingobium sp. KA1]QSR16573.1 flagellar biosynthesis protein FlgL [Novosphingobium sp. KA1]
MTIVSTSTAAFFERSRRDIKDLRTQAESYQSQLSSGQKIDRSSDNPVAASRLRTLSRLEALSDIDQSTAERANADLSLADSAMSDMADALIRAQELATQASNSTLSDDQRSSIGAELDQIFTNLLALANARDSNGHALFGGASSGDAYSLDAAGNAVYVGTASSGTLPLGEGQSVTRSMTGPEFLSFTGSGGSATDLLAVVRNVAEALQGAASDPTGAAAAALTDLKTGLDSLTTGQTVIGTRLAWIEVTGDRRTDLSALRSTEESDIGAADLATTIAQLQETMTVLEASQATFGKLASLNLFSQLG